MTQGGRGASAPVIAHTPTSAPKAIPVPPPKSESHAVITVPKVLRAVQLTAALVDYELAKVLLEAGGLTNDTAPMKIPFQLVGETPQKRAV